MIFLVYDFRICTVGLQILSLGEQYYGLKHPTKHSKYAHSLMHNRPNIQKHLHMNPYLSTFRIKSASLLSHPILLELLGKKLHVIHHSNPSFHVKGKYI